MTARDLHEPERRGPPRAVLIGAGLLAGSTLLLGLVSGQTGVGRFGPAPVTEAEAEVRVSLRFDDRPDGSVTISDVATGEIVGRLPPGGGNFERGALRALVRQRMLHGLVGPPTFELSRPEPGRLLLSDPLTDTRIDLAAFGPTNLASFARLLPKSARNSAAERDSVPAAAFRR